MGFLIEFILYIIRIIKLYTFYKWIMELFCNDNICFGIVYGVYIKDKQKDMLHSLLNNSVNSYKYNFYDCYKSDI